MTNEQMRNKIADRCDELFLTQRAKTSLSQAERSLALRPDFGIDLLVILRRHCVRLLSQGIQVEAQRLLPPPHAHLGKLQRSNLSQYSTRLEALFQ